MVDLDCTPSHIERLEAPEIMNCVDGAGVIAHILHMYIRTAHATQASTVSGKMQLAYGVSCSNWNGNQQQSCDTTGGKKVTICCHSTINVVSHLLSVVNIAPRDLRRTCAPPISVVRCFSGFPAWLPSAGRF